MDDRPGSAMTSDGYKAMKKAYQKAYRKTEKYKAYNRAYMRAYRQRRKAKEAKDDNTKQVAGN